MAGPPNPIDTREKDGRTDYQARPVHVIDRRDRNGHVQWGQVHADDNQGPADRDDVDGVSPFAEIKVRAGREDFAPTQEHLGSVRSRDEKGQD